MRSTRRWVLAAIAAAILGNGCDDGKGSPGTGPEDAGPSDAGFDAGTDAGPPPVHLIGDPTLALVGASASTATLEVFARGDNGIVYRRARTSGTWGTWATALPSPSDQPHADVASWGDGRLDLIVRGTCGGQSDTVCQRFRTTAFGPAYELGAGATGLEGRPTIASATSERLLVASAQKSGADESLAYRYWNGGAWTAWATYDAFPSTTPRFDALGYADGSCTIGGSCTTYESYYVASAASDGAVSVARLVVIGGAVVGTGFDTLPAFAGDELASPSIAVSYDSGVRVAVYATTTPAPGTAPSVVRLQGQPLAVDHEPATPGDYQFDATNVTWAASWTTLPAPTATLASALDCVSSSLLPTFEACAALGTSGEVWLLERVANVTTWRSLGKP